MSEMIALLVRRPVRQSVVVGLTILLTMISSVPTISQSPSEVPDKDKQKIESIRALLGQSYELTQRDKYDEALPLCRKSTNDRSRSLRLERYRSELLLLSACNCVWGQE